MPDHSTSRRTLLAGSLTGSALGALVLTGGDAEAAVTVPSSPAVQFFLDLSGITGDSLDPQYPGSFDVFDWSAGVSTSVGPTNHGGALGKVKPRPFTFVIRTDKASPKLFLACCQGKHFKKATLEARRLDAKQPYLSVEIKDAYVSSYQQAPGSVDAVPLDVVTLDYGTFTMTFTPQNPDGSLGTPVVASFDFLANAVV